MKTFFVLVSLTFFLFLVAIVLISYCKRRQHRTKHGLTGMCHDTGGPMCCSCSSRMLPRQQKK